MAMAMAFGAVIWALLSAGEIMSEKFAFLVHPRTAIRADMAGWFAPLGWLPEGFYRWGLRTLPIPPITAGTVTLGERPHAVTGSIILVPFSAQQMLHLPREQVRRRVDAAVDHAVGSGARIVGLGALTAPVTEGGQTLAHRTDIGVTNGNAFTAAMILQAVQRLLGRVKGTTTTVAIIGAAGSVGSCVTRLLAQQRLCDRLLLVGRRLPPVDALAEEISASHRGVTVQVSDEIAAARAADLVIVLTSASDCLIQAEHLKQGATVLDATQPRNTARTLLAERPDLLVVDGGLVALPGARITVKLGLPRGCVYACLAETMLLTLAGHAGHFSLGPPTTEQALYIEQLAQRYQPLGFTLAPFHSFGQPLANSPENAAGAFAKAITNPPASVTGEGTNHYDSRYSLRTATVS